MHRKLIAAATPVAGLAFMAIGSTPALAADGGHHHDARVRKAQHHDARVDARREARQAARAAAQAAQGTTTTAGPDTSPRHTGPRSGSAGRVIPGVVPCAVTSAKPVRTAEGAQSLVTNGCDDVREVVIAAQAQVAGPWHHGICKETGACYELARFTIKVLPGSHYVAVQFTACRVQVDVSLPNGHLLRAAQFGEEGCKPVVPPHDGHGKPPVQTHPRKPVSRPHGHAHHLHASPASPMTSLPRTGVDVGDTLMLAGGGLAAGIVALLFGLGGAEQRRTRAMRRAIDDTASAAS